MSLSDLFKPAWKHSNPDIRLKAVQKTVTSPEVLSEIIRNTHEHHEIRKAAIEKLGDKNVAEILFYEVHGECSEELRKLLLRYISNEQKIREMYTYVRRKGGLSFLEIVLEQRLFEIWDEAVASAETDSALVAIAQNARKYPQGSYVSSGAYGIAQQAVSKITNLHVICELLYSDYKYGNEIHYSYRNGLAENPHASGNDALFEYNNDLDFLVRCIRYQNKALLKPAEKRLADLGKKVIIEERTITRDCSSCHGSRGGDVRVPYTDNDWAWEQCDICNGSGKETIKEKEYRLVDYN